MKNFVDINALYEKSKNLSEMKDRLELLDQLNSALNKFIANAYI